MPGQVTSERTAANGVGTRRRRTGPREGLGHRFYFIFNVLVTVINGIYSIGKRTFVWSLQTRRPTNPEQGIAGSLRKPK